jgi:hypothetical protein
VPRPAAARVPRARALAREPPQGACVLSALAVPLKMET